MIPDSYLGAYYLYYVSCFLLGGFIFTGSTLSLIFGVAESAVNIFLHHWASDHAVTAKHVYP
jgi:hypothetical protein